MRSILHDKIKGFFVAFNGFETQSLSGKIEQIVNLFFYPFIWYLCLYGFKQKHESGNPLLPVNDDKFLQLPQALFIINQMQNISDRTHEMRFLILRNIDNILQ